MTASDIRVSSPKPTHSTRLALRKRSEIESFQRCTMLRTVAAASHLARCDQ